MLNTKSPFSSSPHRPCISRLRSSDAATAASMRARNLTLGVFSAAADPVAFRSFLTTSLNDVFVNCNASSTVSFVTLRLANRTTCSRWACLIATLPTAISTDGSVGMLNNTCRVIFSVKAKLLVLIRPGNITSHDPCIAPEWSHTQSRARTVPFQHWLAVHYPVSGQYNARRSPGRLNQPTRPVWSGTGGRREMTTPRVPSP